MPSTLSDVAAVLVAAAAVVLTGVEDGDPRRRAPLALAALTTLAVLVRVELVACLVPAALVFIARQQRRIGGDIAGAVAVYLAPVAAALAAVWWQAGRVLPLDPAGIPAPLAPGRTAGFWLAGGIALVLGLSRAARARGASPGRRGFAAVLGTTLTLAAAAARLPALAVAAPLLELLHLTVKREPINRRENCTESNARGY